MSTQQADVVYVVSEAGDELDELIQAGGAQVVWAAADVDPDQDRIDVLRRGRDLARACVEIHCGPTGEMRGFTDDARDRCVRATRDFAELEFSLQAAIAHRAMKRRDAEMRDATHQAERAIATAGVR